MKQIKLFIVFLLISWSLVVAQQKPKNNPEDWSEKPVVVQPGTNSGAPSDAIILFTKNSLDQWESVGKSGKQVPWTITGDYFTVVPGTGSIATKRTFGDCQLHVEWKVPACEKKIDTLKWGNSGINLMGLYEVQIYSSWQDEHKIYYNGQAGSIYKQYKPLVNACRPAGEWQVYDIVFTAPRFNADKSLNSPGKVTVFHNGILIQNQVTLKGTTGHGDFTEYNAHPQKLPLQLQEHKSYVSYRNIWIREL